ncbi:NCS2 family permease [Priestia megaterium]
MANESTFVGLGNVMDKGPLLAIFGLILAAVLMAKNVKGALIISIFATTILAMIVGVQAVPHSLKDVFSATPPSVGKTFFQMDLKGAVAYGIFSVVFSFTIVELFDTLATLIGLSKKANLVDRNGKIPSLNRALAADSIGTMASAIFGSTALNTYIENATGIAEGGRTGLKALTVAILFIFTLFLHRLFNLSQALLLLQHSLLLVRLC